MNCARKGGGQRWAVALLGRQRFLAQFRPKAISRFYYELVFVHLTKKSV